VLFAFNQGEVCTCPSRALIQESIYDRFMERVPQARRRHQAGQPARHRHHDGRAGSQEQMDKILSYLDLGKQEGAEVLIGGERAHLGGDLAGGYYIQPTLFKGHNKMRIFQEEIFGPVLAVTTFKDEAEALADRQRHPVRPGRRRVEPRRQRRLPHGPRHPGRPRVDQLLPRLPGARGLRRLQGIRHRPRNPQDHARPLPADQEPAGQLQRNKLGFFKRNTNTGSTPS
jgi:hypothetical protein